MDSSPQPSDCWPLDLAARCAALRQPGADPDHARAAAWLALHAALFAALRAQSRRVAGASHEDLEDLASAKALELLARAEVGAWDPAGRPAHEIAGYIARVARNGLVDLARRRGFEAPRLEDDAAWDTAIGLARPAMAPEEAVAAREFAVALRQCVEGLAPRARQVWFRRAFFEWPSRDIAALVGLPAAHVDMIVSRARAALRTCMESRGIRSDDVRAGAFAEIWPAIEREWRQHEGERFFEEA